VGDDVAVLSLPVSFGDAADRITILEIKKGQMADPEKRAHVAFELDQIRPAFFAAIGDSPEFRALFARLKVVNEQLWVIEDDIRDCEARGDFGPAFVRLARAVYRTNDERARIKREINLLLNSPIIEEKSYGGP
jgi:hypothetical protein